MFKIVVLALAALQFVYCIPNVGDPCKAGDKSIHIEGTCSKYLFCGNNVWNENYCHPGYRLDLNTMYCNIRDDNCVPCLFYIKANFEFKTVSGNCNKYYVCVNDLLTQASCPTGMYYNSAIRACDLPENVTGC
ncbi:unnamed protein product [Brachionus calyciflorus]|uniref:Chitin-binding type-2 domain-containing protein n=1 Tax=Brachionus calyciflorus TaxID=104777 RepID=A0A814IUM4_9BILA|nr:unnamed protein product [Brachionus calyciflorus]